MIDSEERVVNVVDNPLRYSVAEGDWFEEGDSVQVDCLEGLREVPLFLSDAGRIRGSLSLGRVVKVVPIPDYFGGGPYAIYFY